MLADLTATSSAKQTRNSAGKTSTIEILHFLLGAEADKRSLFKKPEIINHSFTAKFRFEGGDLEVTRTGADDKKILIDRGQANLFGIVAARDDESGREYVTLDDWKAFLGATWFKLPKDRRGTDFEGSFTPSFRSLIAYFARRRKSGGYGAVQKQNANQQPWDSQVNLSYLIGLDWRIPRDIQDLQARKKGMQNLKKAIKEGDLGAIFGSSAEIRPEIVRTEERLTQLKARIDSFQVLETYRETAADVSALKIRMNAITLELSLADETIAHLNKAIKDEEPPPYASVERLYSEAGIQLPTISLRRFDEVQEFQNSVVANRRKYLEQELETAQAEIVLEIERITSLPRSNQVVALMLDRRNRVEQRQCEHEPVER